MISVWLQIAAVMRKRRRRRSEGRKRRRRLPVGDAAIEQNKPKQSAAGDDASAAERDPQGFIAVQTFLKSGII